MKLSSAWQTYDIYMQLHILQSRWQHHAGQQELVSVPQGEKLVSQQKESFFFFLGVD
jgi:hypothetical protein